MFQPQLTVGALDGGDALGPLLPQHFLAHVETLQEDGHCHVHLHRLLVEQRRDAILEEFQPTVDGRLHRTGQRGAFACGEHIRVAVHRLFDEFIFAAAVIFLIPPLYFSMNFCTAGVGWACFFIARPIGW